MSLISNVSNKGFQNDSQKKFCKVIILTFIFKSPVISSLSSGLRISPWSTLTWRSNSKTVSNDERLHMGQAGREGVSSCDVISELSGREGLKRNVVKSGIKTNCFILILLLLTRQITFTCHKYSRFALATCKDRNGIDWRDPVIWTDPNPDGYTTDTGTNRRRNWSDFPKEQLLGEVWHLENM